MKSNKIGTPPEKILNVGNGKSHFNYNIVESEDEEGATVYEYDYVEVQNPATYERIAVALIRERYSTDDEIAIIRQKETKPEEFNVYFNFVEDCKAIAKS